VGLQTSNLRTDILRGFHDIVEITHILRIGSVAAILQLNMMALA